MAKPGQHVFVCLNSRPPDHPRSSYGVVGANDVMHDFSKKLKVKIFLTKL